MTKNRQLLITLILSNTYPEIFCETYQETITKAWLDFTPSNEGMEKNRRSLVKRARDFPHGLLRPSEAEEEAEDGAEDELKWEQKKMVATMEKEHLRSELPW